jgi:DNA-binding NarL/FixJ family response regulator
VRVIVVDGRALLRASLTSLVEMSLPSLGRRPQRCSTVDEAQQHLSPGDVVIVSAEGLGVRDLNYEVSRLAERGVGVVLVVDADDAALVRRCRTSSAHATVLWSSPVEVLVHAITEAASLRPIVDAVVPHGDTTATACAVPALSPQEIRALVLYASGTKLDTVARRLNVRPTTAREYIERVKRKYAAVGRPLHTKHDLRTAVLDDGWSWEDSG